uniref:Sps1 n=1 Tax=Arundo donax TaxID=35708 RepID=A0A0A9HF57_ARUDO
MMWHRRPRILSRSLISSIVFTFLGSLTRNETQCALQDATSCSTVSPEPSCCAISLAMVCLAPSWDHRWLMCSR